MFVSHRSFHVISLKYMTFITLTFIFFKDLLNKDSFSFKVIAFRTYIQK